MSSFKSSSETVIYHLGNFKSSSCHCKGGRSRILKKYSLRYSSMLMLKMEISLMTDFPSCKYWVQIFGVEICTEMHRRKSSLLPLNKDDFQYH